MANSSLNLSIFVVTVLLGFVQLILFIVGAIAYNPDATTNVGWFKLTFYRNGVSFNDVFGLKGISVTENIDSLDFSHTQFIHFEEDDTLNIHCFDAGKTGVILSSLAAVFSFFLLVAVVVEYFLKTLPVITKWTVVAFALLSMTFGIAAYANFYENCALKAYNNLDDYYPLFNKKLYNYDGGVFIIIAFVFAIIISILSVAKAFIPPESDSLSSQAVKV